MTERKPIHFVITAKNGDRTASHVLTLTLLGDTGKPFPDVPKCIGDAVSEWFTTTEDGKNCCRDWHREGFGPEFTWEDALYGRILLRIPVSITVKHGFILNECDLKTANAEIKDTICVI